MEGTFLGRGTGIEGKLEQSASLELKISGPKCQEVKGERKQGSGYTRYSTHHGEGVLSLAYQDNGMNEWMKTFAQQIVSNIWL